MGNEFKVHMLDPVKMERAVQLARIFEAMFASIKMIVPPGRYLSLVQTKLEEACYFAKKGMAVAAENEE